jgi:aspartyl-tRNA synthetase
MHIYRTHNCAKLRASDVGQQVRLSGWVHRKRDHGGLLFVDLRDHYGLTQIVTDIDSEAFKVLDKARSESVVTITGDVVARDSATVNANLPTGEIEVRAREVTVQSAAHELPLPVFGDAEYPEETRLKYRYLDLRRERLHNNIVLRSNVISSVRRRMIEQGFTEFQTPILTASSPEGARDYLVPSRVHPGKFYALPQAPQMFKQLLMVAGFDRYFQIAPCFRDEDARADRSPGEFYQLDFEMSFVTQDDVFGAIEPVLHGIFEEFANGRKVSPAPFPRIPYRESMLKYGSDKPDLRNPLIISDVTDVFRDSDFTLFADMVKRGMVVRAIPAPSTIDQPRSFFDKLNEWAQSEGALGMAATRYDDGLRIEREILDGKTPTETEWVVARGPLANKLDKERHLKIADRCGLNPGDAVFFIVSSEKDATRFAGIARTEIANRLGLIEDGVFEFCWIVDFPMFEYDEENKKVDFSHTRFQCRKVRWMRWRIWIRSIFLRSNMTLFATA